MEKPHVFNILLITPMLNNYYTLRYLADEIGPVVKGLPITGVFTQESEELVIQFGGGKFNLVTCCKRDTPAMYLHPEFARKKRNSADVLPGAIGKLVTSVSVIPGDRRAVLIIGEERLEALLFGNEPNVLFLDKTNTVIDAFRSAKTVTGKTLTYDNDRADIADVSVLEKALNTQQPILQVLKKTFPHLGPTLSMEILYRSATEPTTPCADVDARRLLETFSNLLNEFSHPTPRVYLDATGTPETFSIIPLAHRPDDRVETFPDVHKAIRFFLSRSRSLAGFEEERAAILRKITDALARDRRSLDALEKELKSHERADEYEQSGHLLMKHLGEIRKGDKHALLQTNGSTERIALDTKLSPSQNAQAFFEKAKSGRRARVLAESRVEGLRQRVASGEMLAEKIGAVDSSEELKSLMENYKEDLDVFSVGKKAEEREQIPFRVFTVDGGFEVWAGRSSQNNDLLTTRYAKPNDLWFHARGSSGSHVILRVDSAKGEPSKQAKEQAASIAAYYSKMKTAKMIPVAMTEKKFVRKPKGAPAGTVVLEREKVIFVEAKLPNNEGASRKNRKTNQ